MRVRVQILADDHAVLAWVRLRHMHFVALLDGRRRHFVRGSLWLITCVCVAHQLVDVSNYIGTRVHCVELLLGDFGAAIGRSNRGGFETVQVFVGLL